MYSHPLQLCEAIDIYAKELELLHVSYSVTYANDPELPHPNYYVQLVEPTTESILMMDSVFRRLKLDVTKSRAKAGLYVVYRQLIDA